MSRIINFLRKHMFSVLFGMAIGVFVSLPPWLSYQNLPFNVLKPVAHPGEAVLLSVERCNSSGEAQTYTIARSIRNEVTHDIQIMEPLTVPIEPGCHRDVSPAHKVPLDTKPGTYSFTGVAIFKGLFGIEHKLAWYSEPFDVVEK